MTHSPAVEDSSVWSPPSYTPNLPETHLTPPPTFLGKERPKAVICSPLLPTTTPTPQLPGSPASLPRQEKEEEKERSHPRLKARMGSVPQRRRKRIEDLATTLGKE